METGELFTKLPTCSLTYVWVSLWAIFFKENFFCLKNGLKNDNFDVSLTKTLYVYKLLCYFAFYFYIVFRFFTDSWTLGKMI